MAENIIRVELADSTGGSGGAGGPSGSPTPTTPPAQPQPAVQPGGTIIPQAPTQGGRHSEFDAPLPPPPPNIKAPPLPKVPGDDDGGSGESAQALAFTQGILAKMGISGSALGIAGPVGLGLGAAAGTSLALLAAGRQAEERLAPFSPDIAIARAEVEMANIERRMSLADRFGGTFAEFDTSSGQLFGELEKLMTRFSADFMENIDPIIDLLTNILKLMNTISEFMGVGEKGPNLADVFNPLKSLGQMAEAINQIAERFKKDDVAREAHLIEGQIKDFNKRLTDDFQAFVQSARDDGATGNIHRPGSGVDRFAKTRALKDVGFPMRGLPLE